MKNNLVCPVCHGDIVTRSRVKTTLDRMRMNLTQHVPYRCLNCHHRFWYFTGLTKYFKIGVLLLLLCLIAVYLFVSKVNDGGLVSPLQSQVLDQKIQTQEIQTQEVQTQEVQNQEVQNQEVQNQEVQNQEVQNQEVQNQEVQNQEVQNQEVQNQEVQNQEVQNQEIQTQEIQTQEIQTQEIQTQEIQTQEIQTQEVQTQEIQTQEIQNQEVQNQEVQNQRLNETLDASQNDVLVDEVLPVIAPPVKINIVEYDSQERESLARIEVNRFINKWSEAWQAGDVDSYLACMIDLS